MLQASDFERHDVEPINAGAKKKAEPLYAARKKIFAKRATGNFRRLKWIIMAITLGIYYLTPWLRWDRGEFAPDQAVLVDIANRRFYMFFIEIWPQEFFFVAGLLVMAGFGLFLITSVVGRAWCGYSCPQTVWTDLFMTVERFWEGDRNARIRLDNAPWSTSKITRRVAKHATFLLISVATGGAWIFYFADAPTLLYDFVTGQAAFVAYATVAILTTTTYLLGGIMREQVCIYMCPWPRIQAAMLDEDSLVVTYNDWRGEPRTKGQKKAIAEGKSVGDCVDCNACVAVCPTGIDIRDGQQLECITCALCIDACNGVMDKVGKERGLIGYATLREYNHNMALATDPETKQLDPTRIRDAKGNFVDSIRHFDLSILWRARTLIYIGALSAIAIGLIVALLSRDRLEVNVQQDRNPPHTVLSDGSIRNGYTLKILNMIPERRVIVLSMEGLEDAQMQINGVFQPDGVNYAVVVEPDRVRALRVFVSQDPNSTSPGRTPFKFIVQDKQSFERDEYDANFEAPEAQ